MHKLFWTDIILILLTILGAYYLYNSEQITLTYALILSGIYITSKLIGYFIQPYSEFETFIEHLSTHSKLRILSGFEIFKTMLVILLFIGFIFLDPAIWIIESILVITMRFWSITFTREEFNA